jgi:hypothetical protein
MDEMPIEVLPRLYERDIDVLLQEELLFNDQVRELFCQALSLEPPIDVRSCALSVVDATGETDVLAYYSAGPRKGILLIENKIDAEFQPHQPERYKARATSLAREGKCEEAFCVLMAPAAYVREGDSAFAQFDALVSYEDVAEAIAAEKTPRAKHRSALLKRAVERAHNAYVMLPDPEVGQLWQRIYGIASTELPLLRMKEPGTKGGQSKWVTLKIDLPNRVTIDWKISRGIVDLSFWKGAAMQPKEQIDLSGLGENASVEKLGEGTIAVRLRLGEIPAMWRNPSDDQIRAGLLAAKRLYEFYKAHPAYFRTPHG